VDADIVDYWPWSSGSDTLLFLFVRKHRTAVERKDTAVAMSYKPPIGDPDLLKKRLITNPKFDHVKSSVECGINGNLARMIRGAEPSIKQGQNEKFRRIRAAQLAQSLEEAYLEIRMREFSMGGVDDEVDRFIAHQRQQQQRPPHVANIPAPPQLSPQRPASQLSTTGGPGGDFVLPQGPKKEYLVLDVRDREDYERCHILNALHFPPTKLSHATNPYTTEILAFKNKDNKVIVLYDLDEEVTVAKQVGNIFFEKGCDNVVVMAGGLKHFVQDFSHLVLGEPPVPIVPKDPRIASRGGTSVSGGASLAEGSKVHSTTTSHKPKSLATSLARPQSNGSWK
jgi:centrosomal protein CEP41